MKLLFTESVFDLETPIKLQKAGCEVFVPKEDIPDVHEFDREALLATVREVQPDILLVGLKFKINSELLDLAPIKAIFTRTTGLDHIDQVYCEARNINIINLKGEELTDVVAVPELCLIMAGYTMRTLYDIGFELKGKTLGIIGNKGRIGRILGDYAEKLGMEVIGIDKKLPDTEFRKTTFYSIEPLLKNSDIVSLNISSIEENRNFFNLEMFKMMKDGSYFLNSARPWLVEEEAFKWALDNKLAGAWVDFELPFKRPNLITTPHLGGRTIESSIKTEKIIVDKIISYVQNNQSNQKT